MSTPFYGRQVAYPGVGAIDSFCRSQQMVSVANAASIIGVSKQTVYRLIRDGILAARVTGTGNGCVSVPKEEALAYHDYINGIGPAKLPAGGWVADPELAEAVA